MTSGSWFSGSRLSSMNCMAILSSVGFVADDSCSFHFPDGGPVIHDGVMLGAAVIPDGDAVWTPAPAHLIFGDRSARNQIVEQVRPTRRIILAVAHVFGRVIIGEVRRKAVDEQHLLSRFRVDSNDGMLGIGILG